MPGYAYVPPREQLESSNIYRLMKRHGIGTLEELLDRSAADPAWFWDAASGDLGIRWDKRYESVLDESGGPAWPRWFVGGQTNAYYMLEESARKSPGRTAYVFMTEAGEESRATYGGLDSEASRLAGGLLSLGMGRGDVIAIYMPMSREAIAGILACAKIGAVCTVVFSGYGAQPLHARLRDSGAVALLASDGYVRKGRRISQEGSVREAVRDTAVRHVIVAGRAGVDAFEGAERYDRLASHSPCGTVPMESEDPLFILYTSGTTGRPKGVVQPHGGFSVFAAHQASYLTDYHRTDTVFWPADIGWITGLVWNVYGLLHSGAGAVIYDGALDHPDPGAAWRIASENRATIFGVSPTGARMLRGHDPGPQRRHDLSHIRMIPSTGEPLDAETWRWLFEEVGGKKTPVANLSGGTEIGGAMLSVLPGMSLEPSTVGMPVPGMRVDCVDDACRPVREQDGYLVVRGPWPAMTRGLLGDPEGYEQAYWSRFEGVWFHGDYVMVDGRGLWYMRGRADDVINVSGHRLGTAEIEQAAVSHGGVADAAAVSVPDGTTGEAVALFYVADGPDPPSPDDVAGHVAERAGGIARPRHVVAMSAMPVTGTGKTVRRALRAAILGEDPGDVSSLENPQVLGEVPRIGKK